MTEQQPAPLPTRDDGESAEQFAASLVQRLPLSTVERRGCVVSAIGTSLRASGLNASIGERVAIVSDASRAPVYADVVGLDGNELILYPLGSLDGIASGASVLHSERARTVPVSDAMLGRVFDGFAQPLDALGACPGGEPHALDEAAPSPLTRRPVDQVFTTGVRAIDSLLTVGVGQRLGIFASAGGGKSTLLSMLNRATAADVVVVALIGERGREVGDFLRLCQQQSSAHRTVTVVATSDRPAMERVLAARAATAIAEGFRARGKRVLLLMDSVTRYARALREVGLSVGEPPVRQGYPPSVFADLPRLFERTGNDVTGSITAFYTVLTDGEDELDPIAEETRSILDGHVVLSRKLGEAGHYPAIDMLSSTSRLFTALASPLQQQQAVHLRRLLQKYTDIEFLLQVGEYQEGTDELADEAVRKHGEIEAFLQQDHREDVALRDSLSQLLKVAS